MSSSTSFGISSDGTSNLLREAPHVQIPQGVQWQEPRTVVQARPSTGSALAARGPAQKAVVTFVEDGDTVRLDRAGIGKPGATDLVCRIDTIDAPEVAKNETPRSKAKPDQAFGPESRRTLQELIANKEVTVRITSPRKSFDRNLCQIEVEGAGVDAAMLQAGAAWLFKNFKPEDGDNAPGKEDMDRLTGMARYAQMNKTGLWAESNPMNPEQFRRVTDRWAKK